MLNATRVAAGDTNLVLGCDVLDDHCRRFARENGRGRDQGGDQLGVVMPATFTKNADLKFPLGAGMEREISRPAAPCGVFPRRHEAGDAPDGDSIATNLFVLGLRLAEGLVPVLGDDPARDRSSTVQRSR